MSGPSVTVILTAHNCADQISGALSRLVALDYSNVDIVVVDDGSSDDTADLCREFASAHTTVTLVVHQRNAGVAAARCSGMEAARGDFVWFCDADDGWEPDVLSVMIAAALRDGADVVCARALRRELNGRTWVMEGVTTRTVLVDDSIIAAVASGLIRGYLWNKLFRRSLLVPLVSRLRLSSQDDFMTVLDALTRAQTVVMIPDVLYEYIEQFQSISSADRRRLDNTAVCHDRAQTMFAQAEPGVVPQSLANYFRLWFLVIPSVTTPVHYGWPQERVESLRSEFAGSITWRVVIGAARHRRRTAAHALLIRLSGPYYPWAYRAVGRALRFSLRSAEPALATSNSGPHSTKSGTSESEGSE